MSWEYQRMLLYRIADSQEVRTTSPRLSRLLRWRLVTYKSSSRLTMDIFKRMGWGMEIVHGVDQYGDASFALTHPTRQLPGYIRRG